ncbi:FxsA family protein [Micromonospora zhanjiangensis]|uniref:FxsA family protein n=1 Tax=Micromonospora zhanjiangensis TaxID=1522057 RepID=A0ABV8KW31_9ACTN
MRRRLRFVPLVLLIAAVVEIAVFVLLGRSIGFGPTILLALVASAAGLVLLRREGLRAWRGFRTAAASGQPPGSQVLDGLVGLAAGLLLALPGLVSAVVGVLLVIPPVRRLARRTVRVATERRVSSMVAGDLFGPRRVRVRRGQPSSSATAPPDGPVSPQAPAAPGPATTGEVVEGEIVEPRQR